MEFLHPEFIYYMLPPLLILFALLLTQKESVATFFSEDVMRRLHVSANILTLKARNALFMLIGALMVVALAEPVIPQAKIEIQAKSADIMVALDISDSMLAEDLYPNRLKLAKEKLLELLRLAPSERIGVIAFAKNSYLVSPLSFDHEAVSFLVRNLSTDSITEKGTDFLSLLEVMRKSMQEESKKYLLILTDGGDAKDFSKEIAFAKERGITIFVLGIATQKGAPIKRENGEFIKHKGEIVVSRLNTEIAMLATKTGGVYIESVNASEDMSRMLQEIEAHSEKKELKSQEIARYIPLFYYPLGLALVLLLIATSSMSKRQRVELPSAFLLFGLLSFHTELNAGLLDFVELKNAKEAYEKEEYAKSAELYKEYAQDSQSPKAYYNAANALYKLGEYKEARELYKQAKFTQTDLKAKNLANLANSYAKEPTQENLLSAKEAYEESLNLLEDTAVMENLEAVKKALEQMQQEQESSDEDEQEQTDENEQESSEEGDSQENQESDSQDKNESDEQKDGQDDEQSNEKETQESDPKDEQESQSDKSDADSDEKSDDTDQKSLEELEDETKDEQESKEHSGAKVEESEEMSEREQLKWLEMLNRDGQTYLYRLNENNVQEEESNEIPW